MMTGRDTTNAFLCDQVRTKQRMRCLTATTHITDEAEIEVVVYVLLAGIVWTMVALVWWLV